MPLKWNIHAPMHCHYATWTLHNLNHNHNDNHIDIHIDYDIHIDNDNNNQW